MIVGIIIGHMRPAGKATLRDRFREGFMAFFASTALILTIMVACGAFSGGSRNTTDKRYEAKSCKVTQVDAAGKADAAGKLYAAEKQ